VRAVDDLVYNTVGLNAKTMEYARTKAGGWDFRRLIDNTTGTLYGAPPSIERMVRNTGYPDDVLVHRPYYGYSSEHAHVNMAGSGNYRKGASYTDQGNSLKPNAAFLAAYVGVILLGMAIATTEIDEGERLRMARVLRLTIKQMKNILDTLFKDSDDDLVRAIRTRLDQVIQ
jgi:hypothetical protein